MALIQNIPQEMIDEHVAWHTRPGNPGAGGRAINPWPGGSAEPAPGSGEEFLVWHDGYIERFHTWVNGLPDAEKPAPDSISAWTEIPAGLKMGMLGWNSSLASDELQLQDMSDFSTLDDLGRFLEWGLHSFLHGASAQMWSEPVLVSFESPRSTYFWQLHGLIDHWRQLWVDAQSEPLTINPAELAKMKEFIRFIERHRPIPWPIDPPRPFPPRPPWPPRPQPDPPPPMDLTFEERNLIEAFRAFRR